MAGGRPFTCKDCHVTGDYDEIPKGMDPRPGTRRVICRDCCTKHKTAMSGTQAMVAPFQPGSQSSKDGARVSQRKVGPQATQVLHHLADAGEKGLTCEQVMFLTDFPVNEATRALNGLHRSPLADIASFKRPAASGVNVQVYVITQIGREFLQQRKEAA